MKRSSACVDKSTIYTADTHERHDRSVLLFIYVHGAGAGASAMAVPAIQHRRVLLLLWYLLLFIIIIIIAVDAHSALPTGRMQWRLVVVVVDFPTTT